MLVLDGNMKNARQVCRGLSNTVDQNPVVSPCLPSENRKSSGLKSNQVYWIHWTRIDSNGKVHFLLVRDLEKFTHVGYYKYMAFDVTGNLFFLFVQHEEQF